MKIDTTWSRKRIAIVGIVAFFAFVIIAFRGFEFGLWGGLFVAGFLGGLGLFGAILYLLLDKIIPKTNIVSSLKNLVITGAIFLLAYFLFEEFYGKYETAKVFFSAVAATILIVFLYKKFIDRQLR